MPRRFEAVGGCNLPRVVFSSVGSFTGMVLSQLQAAKGMRSRVGSVTCMALGQLQSAQIKLCLAITGWVVYGYGIGSIAIG